MNNLFIFFFFFTQSQRGQAWRDPFHFQVLFIIIIIFYHYFKGKKTTGHTHRTTSTYPCFREIYIIYFFLNQRSLVATWARICASEYSIERRS